MKIMMATMALDIGGAETHIVELAKALQSQGHSLLIASAGGAYVAEIEAVGIRHVTIPMHRRKILDMISAKKALKKLILEEKPDIVHSHARIPSFLCGMLHKKMKFPFVTTAHWVFQAGGLLGYLTNWGQRVIAVSEDIKTYLQREYDYAPEHITVTINGIDTAKFSPEIDATAVKTQLNLPENAPVLSYVSRMDQDRALVAEQLIDIAPSLLEEIPDLHLVIVGGGNVFDKLLAKAEQVNQTAGRKLIHMTGPRTDINQFVAVGDVFVGVSRSALEAMAGGKPTIVAGNEGYQGLFTQDSLEEAMAGNFCCRGLPLSTPEQLKKDVVHAFSLSAEEKKALGDYGRWVIFDSYSVGRMAKDCLSVYEDLLKPRYKVLMSGYYGFDNAGDDAILQAIHQEVRAHTGVEGIDITVLSNNPKETYSRFGLKAIPRFDVFAVTKALWQCDALISGGGSLLQDRTSTRSILYYLWVISMGQRFGKPVMFYANGIGPVTRKKNRRRVMKVVERATVVTLRDKDSAEELRSMGVKRGDLHITADPVQAMIPASKEVGAGLLQRVGITGEFITVSVREWGDMGKFTGELAKFCDAVVETWGLQILFVLMQPARDLAVSREVAGKMKQASVILEEKTSPDQLMSVLGQAKLCVAMRLHTLIFSARMGVPLLGLVYDPKVASFLSETGMPSGGKVESFSSDIALAEGTKLLEQYDLYQEKIHSQQEKLEEKAKENQRLLWEMLGK